MKYANEITTTQTPYTKFRITSGYSSIRTATKYAESIEAAYSCARAISRANPLETVSIVNSQHACIAQFVAGKRKNELGDPEIVNGRDCDGVLFK